MHASVSQIPLKVSHAPIADRDVVFNYPSDWAQDSTVLQSNSGDFEMLFWEMPSGKQIKFPADTRYGAY